MWFVDIKFRADICNKGLKYLIEVFFFTFAFDDILLESVLKSIVVSAFGSITESGLVFLLSLLTLILYMLP